MDSQQAEPSQPVVYASEGISNNTTIEINISTVPWYPKGKKPTKPMYTLGWEVNQVEIRNLHTIGFSHIIWRAITQRELIESAVNSKGFKESKEPINLLDKKVEEHTKYASKGYRLTLAFAGLTPWHYLDVDVDKKTGEHTTPEQLMQVFDELGTDYIIKPSISNYIGNNKHSYRVLYKGEGTDDKHRAQLILNHDHKLIAQAFIKHNIPLCLLDSTGFKPHMHSTKLRHTSTASEEYNYAF